MGLFFKRFVSYTFAAVILVAMLYYLIRNWGSVSSISWWKNPGFLSIHIVLLFLTFFLFILGWHRILKTTGSRLGMKLSGYIWLTSNIGKYIPGKVFMVAGRIALLNRFGVRKSMAMSNIIWEHIFITLAIMPFILLVFINNCRIFSLKIIIASICVFIAIIIIVINPAIIKKSINLLLKWFKKPPLDLSLTLNNRFSLFVLYLTIWILYGLTGVTLAYAFGFEDKVSMLLFFNVYIFSWFIGFISVITPGGLGVREGALILMISPYIPMTELIVFACLARVTWTITELTGVLIGLIIGNRLGIREPVTSEL